VSDSSVVEVYDPSSQGTPPLIELSHIDSPKTFSGETLSETLTASARDLDGLITSVEFYLNGKLIGVDSSSPYQADANFSATGYYEAYAVARDNSGYLVTSQVRRVMVEAAQEEDFAPLVFNFPQRSYLESTVELFATYRSITSSYDSDISAMVLVNDQFLGYADKLPYTKPRVGQEDPGQIFTYDLPARSVGSYNVEFWVVNGSEVVSMSESVSVDHSPATDDYEFLKALYQGLYDRTPESAEIGRYLAGLRDGSLTRAQVIEELRCLDEFVNARDILLTHKTLHGVWQELPILLGKTDQAGYGTNSSGSDQAKAAMGMPYTPADANASPLGFYEGVEDDHADRMEFATTIGMNEVSVIANLTRPGDMDVFKIKSKGLENEGLLLILLQRNLFGERVESVIANPITGDERGGRAKLSAVFKDGSSINIPSAHTITYSFNGIRIDATPWRSMLPNESNLGLYQFWLGNLQNVDHYSFSVSQVGPTLGGVRISTSNQQYLDQANFLSQGEIAQLNIESRVNQFDLGQSVNYQTNSFTYTNKYGQIETHDPESFFNRLFRNKYDQEPSPIQSARGVQALSEGTRSQAQFLEQFARENSIITIGGYNYTTSPAKIAIPNVPIDAGAFAETALVYSALLGKAPSKLDVAKLTLTPDFEVRSLADRARLILEMPAYANQYGLAMPSVDFINLRNSKQLSSAKNNEIEVEAVSYGADQLAGTADDGKIISLKLFLNGEEVGFETSGLDGLDYTTFNLGRTVPVGEYNLEAVAEDANGLISRAHRKVNFTKSNAGVIELTSPEHGTVLEKGKLVNFAYSAPQAREAYLEINGEVRWVGELALLDTGILPKDGTTFEIADGSGRDPIVFEFDTDGHATTTLIEEPEELMVAGTGEIIASSLIFGDYRGVESREYIIEIDGNNNGSQLGGDTFRWSIDGGRTYLGEKVEIFGGSDYNLGSGLKIRFTKEDGNELFDRWRIKARPVNQIVQVGRIGGYTQQLEQTKNNLIRAINRARNLGILALRAEDAHAHGFYGGGEPGSSFSDTTILLRHDGSQPIRQGELGVSDYAGMPIAYEEYLPLAKANSGVIPLRIGNYAEFALPTLEVRVIGYDSKGNAMYSKPKTFELVNPNYGYTQIIAPVGDVGQPGRLPNLRFKESYLGGKLPESSQGQIEVIDNGAGYVTYNLDSLDMRVVSRSGVGGALRIEEILSDNGGISKVGAFYPGSGYSPDDVILPSPPLFFSQNESININARLHDPSGNLQMAFYLNGVEINATVNDRSGGIFGTQFMPHSSGDQFISSRILYGDDRDFGPSCPNPFGHIPSHAPVSSATDHWGWKKSWVQQHYVSGQEVLPSWFDQLLSYWSEPDEWTLQSMWSGPAPVRIGDVDAYESVVIEITDASPALVDRELQHAERTELFAVAKWSSGETPEFVEASLYGNNVLLQHWSQSEESGLSEEILASDLNATGVKIPPDRWDFRFKWLVNFKEFVDSFGKVDLLVVAVTDDGRQITSNLRQALVSEVRYEDGPSAASMIFTDIAKRSPTNDEVTNMLENLDANATLADTIDFVIDYSLGDTIDMMTDLIAAHHVIYGSYHSTQESLESDFEEWESVLSEKGGIRNYIINELDSSSYSYSHGQLELYGESQKEFYQNRKKFVDRHFKYKYGTNPSTVQSLQGTKKMWDFAEAQNFAEDQEDRHLIIAADFIYNLVTEPTSPYGNGVVAFLHNMPSIRDQYRELAKSSIATRIEKESKAADAVEVNLSDLESRSYRRIIEETIEARGFKQRFNILWGDSASVPNTEFWKYEPWFGYFSDIEYPWIYHLDLGWLYSSGTSSMHVWLFSESLGWFWINRDVFMEHPNLRDESERFIFRANSSQGSSSLGAWSLLRIMTAEDGARSVQVHDYKPGSN
jgi:hypothetical protein